MAEDELAKSSAFFASDRESVSGNDITGRENAACDQTSFSSHLIPNPKLPNNRDSRTPCTGAVNSVS